jgi:type I restriction enzyme S subunit
MSEWQTEPLDACLEALLDYRGKSPPKSPKGIPVLSAKVVKTTGLLRPIEQKIATEYYPQWMVRGLPRVGDVVMTTEAPMGEVIQLDSETVQYALGQRIVCMRGKEEKLDNTFLRYLLTSPSQQAILASYATGTTVLGISQKALRSVPISYPRFGEQRRIGELLGALDDKIELNRRMNETLEAMARAMFKDWFVDFGPTRAKMEGRAPYLAAEIWSLFPDRFGTDGKPEGWHGTPLTEFFSIIGGGTPKTSNADFWDGPIPWFSVTDTPTNGSVFVTDTEKTISEAGLNGSSARLVPIGTTIISARGTVGNLAVAGRDMTFNQSCYGLRGTGAVGDYATYLIARNMVSQLQARAHGSVFSTITRQTFESLSLPMPSQDVLSAFEDAVAPLFDKILANVNEVRTLAQTRDLLLPKLMSGEVRVKNAEKLAGGPT